ncbi:hypothetical protein DFH06DRAFT_292063 [Mycena polygramma]|nr:hypothetical protein DFH06DRAFT_292063 [Mycena polygramma]
MPGPALAHNVSEYTPAEAEQYTHFTFTQNYVVYATSALLVYELIITFDEEVERVWSLKWRLPKFLFMLNRYVTRALLLLQYIAGGYPGTSESFCQIYGYWQIIPPRLAILAAQAMMVIRLWAIYNNTRTMLYFLIFVYLLEVVAVVTCMFVSVAYTQGTSQPAPLSCGLDARSPLLKQYASGTWIAPVFFELLILVMTLVKVFPPLTSRFRLLRKVEVMKGLSIATRMRNPTLDMLARDSIIYFAFIFTFTLCNAILYETSFAAYYRAILLGPTSAISCIAVSRMIINMRSLPGPNLTEGPSESMNLVASNVVFAENSAFNEGFNDGSRESGVSEVRRMSVSQSTRGRVMRKEREFPGESESGYEMVSTPRTLRALDGGV